VSKGFSWNEVEPQLLDVVLLHLGPVVVTRGLVSELHLLEPMYNGRVKLMLVTEMSLIIAAGCECFRTEGAMMASR
jgi:hypothetical protein